MPRRSTRSPAPPARQVVAPADIYDVDADIFSPNALGAIINPDTLPRLRVRVVAGGANNQLATPEMGDRLREKGIVYAPDYVINGGGIINVASEISGTYDPAWVEAKVQRLIQTLGERPRPGPARRPRHQPRRRRNRPQAESRAEIRGDRRGRSCRSSTARRAVAIA